MTRSAGVGLVERKILWAHIHTDIDMAKKYDTYAHACVSGASKWNFFGSFILRLLVAELKKRSSYEDTIEDASSIYVHICLG